MKCYVTRDCKVGAGVKVWREKPDFDRTVFYQKNQCLDLLLVSYVSALGLTEKLGIPTPNPGECIEWELPDPEPAARELDPDEIPSVSLAIVPGAVVRMKCGGPKMVVVHRNADSSVVGVTWFGDSHIKDARGVPSVALEVCDD